MTPQEQELVNELFHRLAQLESNPRDPSAERLIADQLRDAPRAIYALVQTALVQDEALKRANARIEELQAQTADKSRQHGGLFSRAPRPGGSEGLLNVGVWSPVGCSSYRSGSAGRALSRSFARGPHACSSNIASGFSPDPVADPSSWPW